MNSIILSVIQWLIKIPLAFGVLYSIGPAMGYVLDSAKEYGSFSKDVETMTLVFAYECYASLTTILWYGVLCALATVILLADCRILKRFFWIVPAVFSCMTTILIYSSLKTYPLMPGQPAMPHLLYRPVVMWGVSALAFSLAAALLYRKYGRGLDARVAKFKDNLIRRHQRKAEIKLKVREELKAKETD